MTKNDNPHMYMHFIEQHLEAYTILKDKYPLPVNLFFVKAFLLGRMIELILKTDLIMKGFSSDDLKKKERGGHSLIKLLELLGFPNKYIISTTTFDSINHLSNYYENKKYEYPQSEDVEIKNIVFLEEFISLSIQKLKFHLKNP